VEPERPSEKLLREYARDRLVGTEGRFSLHPANRRVLQGEVARRYRKTAASRRGVSGLIALLGGRPAWSAAAALLILSFAAWMMLREPDTKVNPKLAKLDADKQVEMARNEPLSVPPPVAPVPGPIPASEQSTTRALATAPASAAFPSVSPSGNTPAAASPLVNSRSALPDLAAKDANSLTNALPGIEAGNAQVALPRYGLADSAKNPLVVIQQSPAASNLGLNAEMDRETDKLRAQVESNVSNLGFAYQRVPSKEETPLTALDEAPAGIQPERSKPASPSGGRLSADAPTYSARQNFARSPAPVSKSKTAYAVKKSGQDVLNNFELRQNGADIELVDEDGSIYRGTLETNLVAAAEQVESKARRLDGATITANRVSGGLSAPTQNQLSNQQNLGIPFRVAGTNRTLRQTVVFNGQLQNQLEPFGATNQALQAGRAAGNQPLGDAQRLLQNSFSNSQISGRLRVGKEPETELLAVPKSSN